MLDTLGGILKEFGPYVTLLVFFIYRDYRRELHQSEYIENLVSHVVEIASRYNITTQAVIEATNRNSKITQKTFVLLERALITELSKRPTEELHMPDDSDDNLNTSTFEPLVYPDLAHIRLRIKRKGTTHE